MSNFLLTSYHTLDTIARHCPTALSTYIVCVGRSNDVGQVTLKKYQIVDEIGDSWAKFNNNLRRLYREGVLEYHRMDDMLQITLTPDEMADADIH